GTELKVRFSISYQGMASRHVPDKDDFTARPERRALTQIYGCFVACGAGFGARLCAGRVPPPAFRMVILLIFTGSFGRSFSSRGMRAIFLTSSTVASSHWPKMV